VSARKAAATKAKTGGPTAAATSVALVIDPAQLDLLPRPMPSPEVMAAIAAAAQLVWPQPAAPDAQDPVHDTWRFSGRWWAQPAAMRRARPWTRR
jgi:hypothetical protein